MISAIQNCSKFVNRTHFGKRFIVLGRPTGHTTTESNFKLFQTSHFGPKSNFQHVEHHKKQNSSQTSNCLLQD